MRGEGDSQIRDSENRLFNIPAIIKNFIFLSFVLSLHGYVLITDIDKKEGRHQV